MHAAFGHVLVHVSVCVCVNVDSFSRTCAYLCTTDRVHEFLVLIKSESGRVPCAIFQQTIARIQSIFQNMEMMTDGPLFNQGRKGFLFNVSMSNWSFQCPNMKLEMSLGSLCSSGRFVFFIPFCAPCSTKSCVRFCYYSVAYMGQFLFYNQKEQC